MSVDGAADPGDADVRTYYGEPILKDPAWTDEVPWYLFVGGWSGASAVLAAIADLSGDVAIRRAASRIALAGAVASPVLLILDRGRGDVAAEHRILGARRIHTDDGGDGRR